MTGVVNAVLLEGNCCSIVIGWEGCDVLVGDMVPFDSLSNRKKV